MDRVACVNAEAFPLQLLLRDCPGWRGEPAAVVDRETPMGVIQWVNAHARRRHIYPGMRFAAALSLCRDLQAGEVADTRVSGAVEALLHRLWRFSPRVEPAAGEPGVFWLDASGLGNVFPSLEQWAGAIQADLRAETITAVTAVGFSRFGGYAAAKAATRNIVFPDAEAERRHVRQISMDCLEFSAGVRETLTKLGVKTLGQFMDMPPAGIRRRFGAQLHALHEMAQGAGWRPLASRTFETPAEETITLDYPVSNSEALMAALTPAVEKVIQQLSERHERLAALWLALRLDDGKRLDHRVAPAAPTDSAEQIVPLARLRLGAVTLSAGVVECAVRGEGVAAVTEQLDLLDGAPDRSRAAIHRAFAKLRAEFGPRAVVRARLHERHLPEACFSWESMETLPQAQPAPEPARPLVRRFLAQAGKLPRRPRHEPNGWLVAGPAEGPVEEIVGPHELSGGWWRREVARSYYCVRVRSGRWFWVYYDEIRRAWFLQGAVE